MRRMWQLEYLLRSQLYLDTVGEADYALGSTGAYVIETLTSPTYTRHLYGWRVATAQPAIQHKIPALALSPETQPGQCWAMAGTRGTLGVALARTIIPSAFTVDHVAKQLALQFSSAPRDVEVWGLFLGSQQEKTELGKDKSIVISSGADLLYGLERVRHGSLTFFRLANFTYNIHAFPPTQTFRTLEQVHAHRLPTNAILFRFESNWGHEDYTCIYRVRVHGENMEK